MDAFQKYPPSILIAVIILVCSYLVITAVAFYTPHFSVLSILIPVMGGIFLMTNGFNDWLSVIHSNKVIFFMDGSVGTIVNGPVDIGAGKVRYIVAMKYRYAPPERRYFLGNLEGFITLLTGEVNITLEAPSKDFYDVPEMAKNPVEGAVLYYGNIFGKFVCNPKEIILQRQQEFIRHQELLMNNIIEKLKNASSQLTRENNGGSITQAQNIHAVFKEIIESVAPMYNPAIQAQNAVAAIAAQQQMPRR